MRIYEYDSIGNMLLSKAELESAADIDPSIAEASTNTQNNTSLIMLRFA